MWSVILLLGVLVFQTGCVTQSAGHRHWGSQVTLTPGWQRLKNSTAKAVTDPHVWIPTAGAIVFSLGDLDEEVSDWAIDKTPLFGSPDNAKEISDDLRNLSSYFYYATALFTHSGHTPEEWLFNKAKAVGVASLGRAANDYTNETLKRVIDKRPPAAQDFSFPSGHTNQAGYRSALAVRNLDAMPISDRARFWSKVTIHGVAGLTGWARVEAASHFPSDVMAGYALGHFFGFVVNDAFITPMTDGQAAIFLEPSADGALLTLHWAPD